MWYAITVFGAPSKRYQKVHRNAGTARACASELKGSGTCTCARVVRCRTRAEARAADVSDPRLQVVEAF